MSQDLSYETVCGLLGEKDLQIYHRNVTIATLQAEIAVLTAKVKELETPPLDTTPSLSKSDESPDQ